MTHLMTQAVRLPLQKMHEDAARVPSRSELSDVGTGVAKCAS